MPAKTQKKTPQNAKELFKPFLFPCNTDKTARVNKGHTWLYNKDQKKTLTRSTDSVLCGMDCGHSGITVVDFDTYKPEFKKSKEAKAFLEECKKRSQFKYQTPSGGWHIFFRGSIKSTSPFPGIEIKSKGGYICLYQHPAQHSEYNDWDSFYKDLPEWNFRGWGMAQKEHREFGPGKNNTAIPQRAGKAGYNTDFEALEDDLLDMIIKNRNNPEELKKHIKDYKNVFKKSMLWKSIPKKAQLKILEIAEKTKKEEDILEGIPASQIEAKTPVAFYGNILLDYEFNFVYGDAKVGKTRGLLLLINKAIENTKKKCAILSSENDASFMLIPLFDALDCKDQFIILNDQIIKYFPKNATTAGEKAGIFLRRIYNYLETNTEVKCLLLDPLPRFLNWNEESLATLMIDGLRDIAKKFEVTIIGVRNEGKNKGYDSSALYKGSSAIGDNSRQVNRGLKCHKKSSLGKEFPKEKTFVIYTELSSLYGEEAYFFKLNIETINNHKVAVPKLIRKLDGNINTIKYLSTKESGQTLSNKIFHFIQRKPEKGCTLDDLYDEFGDQYPEKTIRDKVYKNFDSTKRGATVFIQIKPPSRTDK